jgi:molecular chaperone GrpE
MGEEEPRPQERPPAPAEEGHQLANNVSAEGATGQEGGADERDLAGQAKESQSAAGDDLAACREELQKVNARAEDLLGRWQRTQADFINYKRRVEQERGELTKLATLGLVARILPILDDFERASATLPRELSQLTWIEGVALIEHKLRFILQQEGLTPIEALGKDFDPAVHEAVMIEEGVTLHEGKVVAELQ